MMRTFDNGCFYTVQCTERDVTEFARRWPCFGPRVPITFQFDKRNGDLVDVTGTRDAHDYRGVLALSEDAKTYGAARMALHDKPRARFRYVADATGYQVYDAARYVGHVARVGDRELWQVTDAQGRLHLTTRTRASAAHYLATLVQ
jgi:hypothetical protein